MKKLITAAAGAAALFAGMAHAAFVDLSGSIATNSGGGETIVATDNSSANGPVDISLEAALVSGTFANPNFTSTGGLVGYSSGIGINRALDSHTIDGRLGNDTVVIRARQGGSFVDIQLLSLQFASVDSNDEFTLWVDGALNTQDQNISAQNPALLGVIGPVFQIAAIENNDDFKLAGFTYNLLPDVQEEVPLPGALPLMATVLGGLAMRRRRK
jgi:hypothetical protein